MKPFKALVVVKHPMAAVWATMRDRLAELVPLLDDIESITPIERHETPGGKVALVNEWHTRQRIPALLQARLGADSVSWIDRNTWDPATHRCHWRIEPSVLRGQIECHGVTAYEPAMGGRGTRVTFAGEFELAGGALKSLAGVLEQPVAAFVESIVTLLVPKNLRNILDAAGRLIDTKP